MRASALWGAALAMALGVAAYMTARGLTAWGAPGNYPPVSPILCAIVLGLTWRNVFGIDTRWLPGLGWVGGTVLRAGIALVGLRLTLTGVGSSLALALPVVVGCVATAVFVSISIGRLMGLSRSLRLLIAVGSGICGCTAVMAVSPLVRARPIETTVALTCVALLGSVGMLCYPWFAHELFPGDPRLAGIFLGTAIHDTSQVVGASLIYTQQFGAADAAPYAALTKLIRNSFLLLLVPALSFMSAAPALLGAMAPVQSVENPRAIHAGSAAVPPVFSCIRSTADHGRRDHRKLGGRAVLVSGTHNCAERVRFPSGLRHDRSRPQRGIEGPARSRATGVRYGVDSDRGSRSVQRGSDGSHPTPAAFALIARSAHDEWADDCGISGRSIHGRHLCSRGSGQAWIH